MLTIAEPRPYLLSVDQYHQMIDAGILTADDRVELLEGRIVEMAAVGSRHYTTIRLSERVIEPTLPPGWHTRPQAPVTLELSEPEPDLAVVRGTLRDYAGRHPRPSEVGLVIEVSDTTLWTDRERKAPIYARAGIPQYWIVNLNDDQVEVYSDPHSADPAQPAEYGRREVFSGEDALSFVLDGHLVEGFRVAELLA